MKPITFRLNFHKESTHWVQVILHSSRSVMRRALTRMGLKDSSHTNAACWQTDKPGRDNCIAEIHFGRDHLTLATVVHECAHAAWHRCVLLGFRHEDKRFQEWLCSDADILADATMAFFDKNRIPVRYQTVPERRIL